MQTDDATLIPLEAIDHIAVEADDVKTAVAWYAERFQCRIDYQDDTWALLSFANIRLAFVTKGDHRPHIGFKRPDAESFGSLKRHRDGTRYVYLGDPAGNVVEILAAD
ncbi:MAG: VOC family protein [Pirellulales bacterium]|nr:VOC family protein [Pirellulales bacterium]